MNNTVQDAGQPTCVGTQGTQTMVADEVQMMATKGGKPRTVTG